MVEFTKYLPILSRLVEAGGTVPADTFRGQGMKVAYLVRNGFCEWLRDNPRTTAATALRITAKGEYALVSHGIHR